MLWTIDKRIKGESAYYTINWSPFALADKYAIVSSVPAIGGIVELYFMDERQKLNLFCLVRSWYGGLRSTIRESCDPEIEKDPFRRSILLEHKDKIYYRWSHTESMGDMDDVMFFFTETYDPEASSFKPSERYDYIFVLEKDAGKLVTI